MRLFTEQSARSTSKPSAFEHKKIHTINSIHYNQSAPERNISLVPPASSKDSAQTLLTQCQSFACALSFSILALTSPASAVLNSPNAQIPRTVDAALRRSIPAFNPDVDRLQTQMEEVQYLLRIPQRKPWGSMAANVDSGLQMFAPERRDALFVGTPTSLRPAAESLAADIYERIKRLQLAVASQQPDYVSVRVADVLKGISQLELIQAPGLPYKVPKDYASLPRLTGRAVVELVIERPSGEAVFTGAEAGGVSSRGVVEMTLDGYSAPISAGNFVANVLDGLYSKQSVVVNSSSVYVPRPPGPSKPNIPLEIFPAGEYDPVYRLPLEVASGELPVLPLSISGAISHAHVDASDSFLSGDEWFIYKFDKQQAGLAGLAFDEGRFGVFGYVTKGFDEVVRKMNSGDVIVDARVVEGADRLERGAV